MKYALALLLSWSVFVAQGFAAPHIFHITKSVTPEEVVGVHGGDFGSNPSVWIDHMQPGDNTPNRELEVPTMTASDNYVAFKVPAELPVGVYAVIVRAGTKDSPPAWVNRAEAWHCLDLAGKEITPGFIFRIAGRNLSFTGATPAVRFVRKTDGAVRAATLVYGTKRDEIVQCKAPINILPGEQYHVEVNNGMASVAASWTRMPGDPLVVRAAGADPFMTTVPWGADFAPFATRIINVRGAGYSAMGNGLNDDRHAIQKAIDNAHLAGGGVVYLPPGTYAIGTRVIEGVNYGLILKSNVVIMGAGIGVSTIIGDGTRIGNDGGLICAPPGTTSKIGLLGLTIKSGQYCSMTMNYFYAVRSFIISCRLELNGPPGARSVAWREGAMSVFKDSQFISAPANTSSPYFARQNDFMLKNCTFEFCDDRLDFVQGERVQMENCKIIRSVNSDGLGGPEYGGLVTPSKDFALLNTDFTKSGAGAIPRANDGESVVCEYPSGHLALSKATSVGSTTLTDSTAQWTPNAMVGHEITIVRGPGMGQQRTVTGNTANQLTVSQAWDIRPQEGSVFSVNYRHRRHLIADCRFLEVPRGIWYYRTAIDDLVISNNVFVDTGYAVVIRATQRVLPESYSGGNEFNAMSAILVERNSVQQTSNYLYNEPVAMLIDTTLTSGSEVMGNFYYDCAIRYNMVKSTATRAGWGHYVGLTPSYVVDNVNPSAIGLILEHNWFENVNIGITVNTGNAQTILSDNFFADVTTPIADLTLSGHTRASVGTVIDEY